MFIQQTNAFGGGTDTLKISVSAGWNMISLPMIVPDGGVSTLFHTAVSPAYIYEGKYVRRDTLQPGTGFWLKFAAADTVDISGQILVNDTLALVKGWNMIGALALPLPVSKLTATPSNLIVSQFFAYTSNGYVTADTLTPGQAYWVRASQPGTLSEYCWASAGEALVSPPDGFNVLSDPLLIWRQSECSNTYHLQIGWDSLLTNLILDSMITDTSYQLHLLCDTTREFWRVGIVSSRQELLRTTTRSYRWAFAEQGLVTPGDNGATTLTPTLKWRQTNCPGLYHLQVSKDSSFVTTLVDSMLIDTMYQSGLLDCVETYYWRVGISTYWSRTQRFIAAWRYLGLKDETIEALVADWSNPSIMYAGSSSNFSFGSVGGIFKTTNAGVSWDTLVRGVTVYDIDIHSTNPSILYATLGVNGLTQGGILKTADAGVSWTRSDSGIVIFGLDTGPLTLEIDPQRPETLYCSTGGHLPVHCLKVQTEGRFGS